MGGSPVPRVHAHERGDSAPAAVNAELRNLLP